MTPACTRSYVSMLLLGVCSCVADGPADVGPPNLLSIINGADENGAPSTVKLIGDAGGLGTILCSGSIIADNVVLTAKHCVFGTAPGDWRVETGGVGGGGNFTVREFRMTAGAGIDDEDIAAMILDDSTGETPYAYMRALPFGFIGDDVTLIGYGTTETGSSGRKKTTTDAVNYIDAKWFLTDSVDNGACHGDSGGTALDVDSGQLAGVIVFVTDDECGNGETGSTRTDQFLDLIDGALDDAGAACVPSGADVCGDGVDQDCSGAADDACLAMGEACVSDASCQTGNCLSSEGTCTQMCDWLRPTSCPSNAHCVVTEYPGTCDGGVCTCEPPAGIEGVGPTEFGHCELGAPGVGAVGDACETSSDCANASCLPDDAGALRCLDPCTAAGEGCEAGEACVLRPGYNCGGCVPSESGLGGFGAPCEHDSECDTGRCITDSTGSFCSRDCGDGCPEGFRCGAATGACVHDERPGRTGDPCVENADCESGICAEASDGTDFCTDECSDAEPCPTGFDCSDVGGDDLCVPDLLLLGQECETNEQCLSDLCGHFAPEDWGGADFIDVCTSFCSDIAPCPGEFICRDVSGYDLCVPTVPPPPPLQRKEYGCGCTATDGGPAGAVALSAVALVLAGARRRYRRTPTPA